MDWLQQLVVVRPLLKVDCRRPIGVDPSDNGQEIELIGKVTMLSEELT